MFERLLGHAGATASRAKVVDGKLILSFPCARKPVIWQMDLAQVKASALEVDARGEDHGLILKTPRGETHDIAIFETREAAIKALLQVSRAMERGEGHVHVALATSGDGGGHDHRPSRAPARSSGGVSFLKFMGAVIGVFLLIWFATILWNSTPRPYTPSGTRAPAPAAGSAPSPADQIGIPLSADEFLRSR